MELGPNGHGVGRWVPDEKLLYLTRYLHATRKAEAKFKQRVLIDPFKRLFLKLINTTPATPTWWRPLCWSFTRAAELSWSTNPVTHPGRVSARRTIMFFACRRSVVLVFLRTAERDWHGL